MVSMKEWRYSHSDGLTIAKYDSLGKCLLTAGTDGDVRVYQSLDDDEVSFKVGNCVTALAVKGDEIAVATEINDVRTYTFPEGIQQEILVRFTAQVNSICFSQNSNHLAAGASDFLVKVVNKTDMSQKQLFGHQAPVLFVKFSPDDQILASSSCDGTLKIWDVAKQECIKSLSIFPKCNDTSTSKILCCIDWCSGKQKVIVVPSEKGVKLISTEDWTVLCKLEGSHTEFVSIVQCSPCGRYFASSSINGEISVWDIATKKEIESMKHDTKMTSLDWNPNGADEILFADEMGRFSVSSDICQRQEKDQKHRSGDILGESVAFAGVTEKSRKRSFRIGDDDDDDDDNGVPVSSISKKHRVQNFDNFLDDEAEDEDEDDANISLNLIKEGLLPTVEDNMKEDEQGSLKDFIVEDKPKRHAALTQNFQKSFQPGATPEHLMHRFMTWNTVGIIRCHSEEEISTIDIEFHDASLHHPLHFTNVMNHSMADLSTTAVVLACRSQDDLPSKLVCLHFGTWDSTKEWTVSMNKGEEIVSVALNSKFIAVATNFGFVRIFTVGGLQYHIFSVAGPVVAISICETQLMIVYHQATGKPPSQCLGLRLLEIGRSQWKLLVEQQLPLGFKDTLLWIGFSAEETPFTVDSKGILRMLQRSFGNSWTPVLNLKAQTKTRSDNYWIVGITENPPEARAVLCKAANFPTTLPRPVPSALSFQIPLCDKDTEKGQLEESFITNRIVRQYHDYHRKRRFEPDEATLAQSRTAEIQLLMKLFALSCKSERIFRALEICELMPNADAVNLAIQYATKMRRMNLAQRLVELARRKADEEETEEDGLNDVLSEDDDIMSEEEGISPKNLRKAPLSVELTIDSHIINKQSNALLYNRKRSIGRPKPFQRIHKDSAESLSGGSDIVTWHSVKEGEIREGTEDLDADDINMDEEIIMENEIKDGEVDTTSILYENGNADSQMRSNPFKLTPNTRAKAVASTRGTSYFESLKSTMPPKKKLGISNSQPKSTAKDLMKQGSKQSKISSKRADSIDDKSNGSRGTTKLTERSKKRTGFMLFRESLASEWECSDSEELVSKCLEKWKSLSANDKKTWNEMARNEGGKGEIRTGKHGRLDLNDNKGDHGVTKTLNEAKETTNECTQSSTSKLAAFAFKKIL